MNTSFSIGGMISQGWATFKKHWGFLVVAGIVTVIINIVLRGIQGLFNNANSISGALAAFAFIIISFVVGIIIQLGWSRVILQLNRADDVNSHTFQTAPLVWWRYFKVMVWCVLYFIGCAILVVLPFGILTAIGFFAQIGWLMTTGAILASTALVIFTIYFGIRYQFVVYATLDYPELRSRAIFKKAGAMTKGHLLHLFAFGVVLGLVNLLGLICLVVGLAATIPTTRLAQARVYDYLKNKDVAPEPAA